MSKNSSRLTRGPIIHIANDAPLDENTELVAIDLGRLAMYRDLTTALREMLDSGRRDTVAKIFHVDWIHIRKLLDLLAELDDGEFGQHS